MLRKRITISIILFLIALCACCATVFFGFFHSREHLAQDSQELSTPEQVAELPATQEHVELSQEEQIKAYIIEVFGDDAGDAFKILECENRNLDPLATNHNTNGSVDRGIFQVNSIHGRGELDYYFRENIDYAHQLFIKQGWNPWSCRWVLERNA